MLELRPTCEHCNKPLPPNSTEAMICMFECTFCINCVEKVVHNVCPSCGGGFTPRPIRPTVAWVGKASLEHYPATTKVTHKPIDQSAHDQLLVSFNVIASEKR